MKFWIGVASRDHVNNGVSWGIAQFCHGKKGPASKLKKGDRLIYYSPKDTMNGKIQCQKFTAIGVVNDDTPYQVEMAPDFKPWRRNITFTPEAVPVDIKQMVGSLGFIKNKSSWGATFRFGFLEIDRQSYMIIGEAMLGPAKFQEFDCTET